MANIKLKCNDKDIENIIFAVIDKNSENYKAFKEIIKN